MSTTREITDDGGVRITTFYGGKDRGRCFTIHFDVPRYARPLEATFTEGELREIVVEKQDNQPLVDPRGPMPIHYARPVYAPNLSVRTGPCIDHNRAVVSGDTLQIVYCTVCNLVLEKKDL